MYAAHDKKPYVATYKEIIIGFAVFALILIVLYPKDSIEKAVLSETSNYDLSILYLKNMLKNDPNNEKLLITLAQKSFAINKKDLSYALVEPLKKSFNAHIQAQAYILSYKIAKEDYLYYKKIKNTTKKSKKLQELKSSLHTILIKKYYSDTELPSLYQESQFLSDVQMQYYIVQIQLKLHPTNIKLLTKAYFLSYQLKQYEKSIIYLDKLLALDTKHKQKWKKEKFFILATKNSYKLAERQLQSLAKSSSYWQQKLINFYIFHKKYKNASHVYMLEFHHTTKKINKQKLWLKAIKTLQAGNLGNNAVVLAHRYENYFFENRSARIQLLKLYISQNKLQYAHQLAKKILRKKGKFQ